MAAPNELSLESVRDFMIMHGGKVTNHDLVTHFKYFLTNPQNRGKTLRELILYEIRPQVKSKNNRSNINNVLYLHFVLADARHQFKEIVNTVATVIRGDDVTIINIQQYSSFFCILFLIFRVKNI